MRGAFAFQTHDPEGSAGAYIRTLAHELDLKEPDRLEIQGPHKLIVSGGWLVSSWNLLACVSLATVRTFPGKGEVLVCRHRPQSDPLAAVSPGTTDPPGGFVRHESLG
jgi:hypothetical protein